MTIVCITVWIDGNCYALRTGELHLEVKDAPTFKINQFNELQQGVSRHERDDAL